MDIHALLEDLEKRIDPEVEDACEAQWFEFLAGRARGHFFRPARARPIPPLVEWPAPALNDTLEPDRLDEMAAYQLMGVSRQLERGGGSPLAVRPNYGVSILPSLFGVEIVVMDRAHETLPTNHALPGGSAAMAEIARRGVPDLEGGLGARVFAGTRRFVELFAAYPKVRRYVHVYHPDLQGPLDTMELVWGSDLFLALYDEPELALSVLGLLTDTYEAFMARWQTIVPPRAGLNVHWGFWHPGTIFLRDDSAMNISPAMYEQFVLPHNERLLKRFNGGGLHACGKVDHWLPVAARAEGLAAFNMSQPEHNDMETVYRHTVDRGLPLLGLAKAAAEAAESAGRDLHGLAHVY